MFKEVNAWRLAVLSSGDLTGRDKMIAVAHASMVERLPDGIPRVHWASNAELTKRAGCAGHDAARVATSKLVHLGFLARMAGPGVRTTHYSYLLRIPNGEGTAGPQGGEEL